MKIIKEDIPKIDITGIPIFAGRFSEAVNLVLDNLNSAKNLCISATGAHGIVYSSDHIKFKRILQSFYLNLPDGMPNVWIGKLKGMKNAERCYGPDFFASLLKATSNKKINHFFCGGKEGVAIQLKAASEKKFANYNVVGTYSPPFLAVDKYDYKQIADQISNAKADIVWIGISTPKQEEFAFNLSKYTNVSYIIAVGAAFDFHIDAIKQAPGWIQKIGMEWFYRLLVEPKRLFKRYIYIVPKYIYLNLLDLIKFA
jgi:N-acetylglucosaminyldiphosphoundecaprenol N-acetyl-beta-D-mannosaminyltransferase